jgi:hypothetical protein
MIDVQTNTNLHLFDSLILKHFGRVKKLVYFRERGLFCVVSMIYGDLDEA